jgi:DNA-binding response OmpR family regulator
MFRTAGYAVAHLEDLRVAGLLLLTGGIDALMLEARLMTPAIEGTVARLRLRSPGVAVITTGEDSDDADIKRALQGGGTVYLPWPFEEEHLLAALTSGVPRRGR